MVYSATLLNGARVLLSGSNVVLCTNIRPTTATITILIFLYNAQDIKKKTCND